ncbi:bacteriocin-protection protein [Sphingobacteriaceae bacterium]|nr:bacteriocin-protection protein [Sphingobacteriaceae bacterium]
MTPLFFETPALFNSWLKKHHKKEKELLVGFYKIATGKKSITWSESVDEALCYGWIDGVRKSHDSESYTIRFTPRKSTSNWSSINIKKISELIKQKKMQPAGLEAFEKRTEQRSKIYSYEKAEAKLEPSMEKEFKSHKLAWTFFQSLAPGYKRLAIHHITNAKQEVTRQKRLQQFIKDCEEGKKVR